MTISLKICVMGLGYIGLPTAAIIASRGLQVLGVDVKPEVVDAVGHGRIHIVEPDLDMLVRAASQTGMLKTALQPEPADVFLIAVPTPLKNDDTADYPRPCIDYVLEAARTIAPLLRPSNLVILESTSPVGTTEKIRDTFAEAGVDISKVHVAYCPERVLPGKIIQELTNNDRIVGGIDKASAAVACFFYRHFVRGHIYETDCRTAEMVKLTENAYRDVNIAFANEISMICGKLGIETSELIKLANCHPRVNVLTPGCGVGGHCIAVDPWFIVDSAPKEARMIRTARETNDHKSEWVIDRIKTEYRKLRREKPIVVLLGLAFKPDIDDLRFSPALYIAQTLAGEVDAHFIFVEPNVESHPQLELTPFNQAIEKADLVVRLVAHTAFKDLFNSCSVPIIDFVGH